MSFNPEKHTARVLAAPTSLGFGEVKGDGTILTQPGPRREDARRPRRHLIHKAEARPWAWECRVQTLVGWSPGWLTPDPTSPPWREPLAGPTAAAHPPVHGELPVLLHSDGHPVQRTGVVGWVDGAQREHAPGAVPETKDRRVVALGAQLQPGCGGDLREQAAPRSPGSAWTTLAAPGRPVPCAQG